MARPGSYTHTSANWAGTPVNNAGQLVGDSTRVVIWIVDQDDPSQSRVTSCWGYHWQLLLTCHAGDPGPRLRLEFSYWLDFTPAWVPIASPVNCLPQVLPLGDEQNTKVRLLCRLFVAPTTEMHRRHCTGHLRSQASRGGREGPPGLGQPQFAARDLVRIAMNI
jgi:hypothetical protein